MKRLLRIVSALVVLTSINALANSVTYTNLNATFSLGPNDGSGDNIGGTLFGPGINIVVRAIAPTDIIPFGVAACRQQLSRSNVSSME